MSTESIIAQTSNNNNNEIESRNELLSNLYIELNSLECHSLTSSTLDKLEESFIKLSQLSSTSLFSSSPLLIACCWTTLNKLIETDYLSNNLKHDKSKSDEYYTLAMNTLNTKENLDYLQGNPTSASDLYETYTRLYLFVARETIRSRNRASELLSVQEWNLRTSSFEQKYKPFLKILLSFIDRRINVNEDVNFEIGIFISLSDDINFIPDLVECELPQHLKGWLLAYIDQELKNSDLCESILITINNVARHEEASNILKNIRMSDVLQDFWKLNEKHLSKDSIAMYYMAYALIVTPDQLKSAIVLHDVIDYLIQNINIASRSSNMRTDMAHISEYLVALARLVVNDNVAQYIIDTCKVNQTTDGLTFFNGLFQKYNTLTSNDLYLKHLSRIALFNIFCSFSFQTTAQKKISIRYDIR